MEYHEAVDYLESLQRRRPKLGTETTATLLSELGRPHEEIDCVQIAGSNGKGSTARMLEQALREDGLDVGLYTSPDLDDVRERILVDGRKIPKERVCSFVDE
ncbi:MAG: dihydropteroate synthase, partial [Natronococcus sp.]